MAVDLAFLASFYKPISISTVGEHSAHDTNPFLVAQSACLVFPGEIESARSRLSSLAAFERHKLLHRVLAGPILRLHLQHRSKAFPAR